MPCLFFFANIEGNHPFSAQVVTVWHMEGMEPLMEVMMYIMGPNIMKGIYQLPGNTIRAALVSGWPMVCSNGRMPAATKLVPI